MFLVCNDVIKTHVYGYLRDLETDWCVLELARSVGDGSGRRG